MDEEIAQAPDATEPEYGSLYVRLPVPYGPGIPGYHLFLGWSYHTRTCGEILSRFHAAGVADLMIDNSRPTEQRRCKPGYLVVRKHHMGPGMEFTIEGVFVPYGTEAEVAQALADEFGPTLLIPKTIEELAKLSGVTQYERFKTPKEISELPVGC
jgi:hypothetical protein